MIRYDMPQGSQEWFQCRLGVPTASQFDRLVTPKGARSTGSQKYMCELVAEALMGESLDGYASELMQRGVWLEGEAFKYYELQRDVETEKIGFCMRDDRSAGCSPDRLVGKHGGLEIKCPGAVQHVANLLGMADKYKVQVQGSMWVCEREWWDLLSYHPTMPKALVRIERDEAFIATLEQAVADFNGTLRAALGQLQEFVHVADLPVEEDSF